MRDWGYHLDLCQAFSMSRWEEKTIAMLKKDMWCFEPVVGYGLAEPPEDFLKGNNRYPFSAMSQKAGEKWATSLPKMRGGQYVGIVSASLRKCTFEFFKTMYFRTGCNDGLCRSLSNYSNINCEELY